MRGRGRYYGPVRGAIEAVLGRLYVGDWPARVWARVPGSCTVDVVRCTRAWLPPGARALRVGYVSDLHVGPTTPPALIAAAARALAGARLDVLLLGGDYVFLEATEVKAAALGAFVREVAAARTFAVLGNHDLWTDHPLLERALEQAGARVLVNERVRLEEGLELVGLDDPWTGARDGRTLEGIAEDATVIVLCHAPEAAPEAARALSRARALYVCGHTHGGHLATPWGPLVVPGHVGRKHPAGMFTIDGLEVHVSRGVGATEVAARTFAPPDVRVFDLVPRT